MEGEAMEGEAMEGEAMEGEGWRRGDNGVACSTTVFGNGL